MPGRGLENVKVKEISSPDNPRFKSLVRLLKASGIKKQEEALIAGQKPVGEILDEFPAQCRGIIFTQGHLLPERPLPQGIELIRLSGALFRELDVHGTHSPILLVRTGRFPLWEPGHPVTGCTLVIPFQDPANVGAVVRAAAAFGVSLAVILKEAAHPFHHKSARAAGSSLFRVNLAAGPSIHEMDKIEVPIIGLSPGGQKINGFVFPEAFALLPGTEGPGLPKGLRVDSRLGIPMAQGMESLNAAMATGIALYAWRNQMKK